MRFMVIVKGSEKSEAGAMPSETEMVAMGKLNEEMMAAGILLGGEGLLPSKKGARVRFSGADRTVVDGPFAEAKELIGGFWILRVKDLDECVAWVKKIPFTEGEVEIRRIGETEDYADAVQTDAGKETLAAEEAMRKKVAYQS